MLFETLALALLLQHPIYGDDFFTLLLNKSGFVERNLPCPLDRNVQVAIFASGRVLYNDKQVAASEATKDIVKRSLDISGVCLYVEGPMSAAAHEAFREIVTAANPQ